MTNAEFPCQMRKARSHRSAAAFTIAEVMMAAAIMALVLTTSITTMQRAFLALDAARNVTQASQIMQTHLERMRTVSWDVINGDGYKDGVTVKIDLPATSRYTLTRTAQTVRTGPPAMKQITYTVSWRGFDGRAQSRSYITYYGQNGLYDYYYNSFRNTL